MLLPTNPLQSNISTFFRVMCVTGRCTNIVKVYRQLHTQPSPIEKDIIIINDTLARSLEPVVTECKEHTIHTQTQVVASRKPKEIERTHEGEANLTT